MGYFELNAFVQTAEEKGKIEGKIEREIEIIVSMHADGLPISTISKYLGLPEDRVSQIIASHSS